MKLNGLLSRTLLILVGLFGVTLLVLASFLIRSTNQILTGEFQSKGTAIAESIASVCVETLLTRDVATIQSMIDERVACCRDVSYILVVNKEGDVICHTFAPSIPKELRRFPKSSRARQFGRSPLKAWATA